MEQTIKRSDHQRIKPRMARPMHQHTNAIVRCVRIIADKPITLTLKIKFPALPNRFPDWLYLIDKRLSPERLPIV